MIVSSGAMDNASDYGSEDSRFDILARSITPTKMSVDIASCSSSPRFAGEGSGLPFPLFSSMVHDIHSRFRITKKKRETSKAK